MNKLETISRIVKCGVLPVIRASSHAEARAAIQAIAEGGIDCIEVTMTVPGAIELIATLSAERSDLLIGAGSVLDPETASDCISAGAKFIVSPATNFDIIEYCNETEIVVVPGALTPTEIVNAWDAGADLVKVFPADAIGGARYIRSLKAPLPQIKLIPTGGVNESNTTDFIRAGAEAIGVGADLVDLNAIRKGKGRSITDSAARYLKIVRDARTITAAS